MALCEAFYRKVPQDELLAPVFAHMHPRHAQHVATWLAEVFGGPATYTAEHGAGAALGVVWHRRTNRETTGLPDI